MDSFKKRKAGPELVSNPFIKKRNLEWRISPPPFRDPERRRRQAVDGLVPNHGGEVPRATDQGAEKNEAAESGARGHLKKPAGGTNTTKGDDEVKEGLPSESALIENSTIRIEDHLAYFSDLLARRTLVPWPAGRHPRLPVAEYRDLYRRCLGSRLGAHFVVTQHDHPVAGPHYDLRLQINETSSCSFAVMYGLPGDPNSRGRSGRTGGGVLRNATETRVHCLWNHLVETAGEQTGSLMVWDSGVYEVLPPENDSSSRRGRGRSRRGKDIPLLDSQNGNSDGDEEGGGGDKGGKTQQERLAKALAARKVRLRLRGSRLPRVYVVNLRLTQDEDAAGRARAAAAAGPARPRRRRRGGQQQARPARQGPETSSDSDDRGPEGHIPAEEEYDDGASTAKVVEGMSEMEKELRELEDEQVRRTNAYTGAVNTVGSVHQRKWFLSLDREACGFERSRRDGKVWWGRVKDDGSDEEDGDGKDTEHRYKWPFYVRGPDHERSVVTGRLGADILKDEGVIGYVRRKGWRAILN